MIAYKLIRKLKDGTLSPFLIKVFFNFKTYDLYSWISRQKRK